MNKTATLNQLISVVIPNYNRQHLITDALNSVFAQSYRPIQVVVVDDGSTDNSVEVIQNWCSKHKQDTFSLEIITQKNAGGNVARNTGIASSKGAFIAFLDSDDTWDANKLELQLELLLHHHKAGAVYCGLRHEQIETGQVTEENRTYPQGNIAKRMLISDVTAPTSTFLVRKQVFEKVGLFDVELKARQDWDMWIRVSKEYEIIAVEQVLVNLRSHDGPRTASNPENELQAYQQIREKYSSSFAELTLFEQRKASASFYRRKGRVFFHYKKQTSTAVKYYFKSLLLWPFNFDTYAAILGLLIPSNLRKNLHNSWNKLFGGTPLMIKSH